MNRRQCPIEDCELPAIFSPLMSSDLTQVCTLKIVSLLMKAKRKTVETFFAFLNNTTGICKNPREKSSCIHLLRPLHVCQEISINYVKIIISSVLIIPSVVKPETVINCLNSP